MTGSSNDLPGSLKASTRSVITTGPLACDVDEAEVEALDAWRARADERREVVRDGRPAGDRRPADIVVDGIVGEKCGQLGGADVGVPRAQEAAHYFDRALHLAPPVVDLGGTRPVAIKSSPTADAIPALPVCRCRKA